MTKKTILTVLLCGLLVGLLSGCREQSRRAKPVIYLYPEEETPVTVALDYDGALAGFDRSGFTVVEWGRCQVVG